MIGLPLAPIAIDVYEPVLPMLSSVLVVAVVQVGLLQAATFNPDLS